MPRWRRVRDACLTACMWALYLLLVRAVLEGAWDLARGRMTSVEGARVFAFLPTLAEYAATIAVNAVILVGWALYNYLRFRGPDRRQTGNPVVPPEIAQHFNVEPDLVAQLVATRIGVLHHHPDGRISHFEQLLATTTEPK